MVNKYKNLLANTIVFTISSFGSKFISFFLVPLYTAVLATSEYGMVDLMTTTAQLLIPVLTLNVQDALLRFSLDEKFNKEDVLRVSYKTVLVSSVLLALVVFLIDTIDVVCISNNYLVFLFAYFVIGTNDNILCMYLRATNKMKLIGICGIVNTFISCIINIILLLLFKMGVNGYMIAFLSGTIVADILMLILGDVLADLKKGKWNKDIAKIMYSYGIPLVANSISWWVNNASDRYILTLYCGTAINGMYSVAYKIPSILTMLQAMFYNAWSVSAITEYDKDDTDGFIGNVFSLYTSVCVVCCSIIMIFNIFIANLIYSNDFYNAWKYVPLLLVGTVFNGLSLFVGCIFTAVKKTKLITSTTMFGAFVNTIINIVLIPISGALGAAFATMIGYFVVFVLRVCKLRIIVRMKVNWKVPIVNFLILIIQCLTASVFENCILQIPFVLCILLINIKSIRSFIVLRKSKKNND